MNRTHWVSKATAVIAWAGVVTSIAASASGTAPQQTKSLASAPERLSEMRHHFSDVVLVHEAVIRGDLPAVRAPAMRVTAAGVPTGVPDSATLFVVALRQAGQRAADATSLADAAKATVAMVGECAKCHRTVGVFPAVTLRKTPQVGGIVGHMLEHQLATDDMLLGLMVPSPVQWRSGAEQLRVAPLRTNQLPRDPKMTKWVREADVRLHAIADRASRADTDEARASAYVELMTTCAQCHSAHSKVWGPGRGTR
jgi:cytochrome c553